jgi:hypothetical protein
MANLGIVIAVSDYTHDAKNLPACSRDGAAIAEVLRLSGRFDDILRIDQDTKSTQVKQRLAEFIKSHSKDEIDEVVFYFTGHGEFYDNEFYYLLTDYQQRRLKQTSLENNELDNIVRSINPSLFVKIVDACHSGMTYIKSPEDFNEYVKNTNSVFKKLYFMFSSQSDQFSYQNDAISYFTESVLKAIANHSAKSIRYKDVIDYVSDDFRILDFQTPFFVTQADFTEILCDVNEPLKISLANYIQTETESNPELLTPQKAIMVELLKEDAKRFCSREEAHRVLATIADQIEQKLTSHSEIKDLYEILVNLVDEKPPESSNIGRWLDKNRGDYFAQATTEVQSRRVLRRPSIGSISFIANLPGREEYVNEPVSVIVGFSFTSEMSFNHLKLRLEPKYPNITPEECFVVPILSRTHVRLFWSFSHFEYVDWGSVRRIGGLDWSTDEAPLKDPTRVGELTSAIVAKFWSFVEEPLRAKWGPGPASTSPAQSGAES